MHHCKRTGRNKELGLFIVLLSRQDLLFHGKLNAVCLALMLLLLLIIFASWNTEKRTSGHHKGFLTSAVQNYPISLVGQNCLRQK